MNENSYQKIGYISVTSLLDAEVRLAWWAMCLEEVLAWHMGVVLDAYTVKRGTEGWTLRIQGRRRLGNKPTQGVVAWANAHDAFACFQLFAALVRRNEVDWKVDKYPIFDEPL